MGNERLSCKTDEMLCVCVRFIKFQTPAFQIYKKKQKKNFSILNYRWLNELERNLDSKEYFNKRKKNPKEHWTRTGKTHKSFFVFSWVEKSKFKYL